MLLYLKIKNEEFEKAICSNIYLIKNFPQVD